MRGIAAALMLIALIGQGVAASSGPGYTAEEARTGCYHTDLRPCMISLGAVFWYDMARVTAQIAKRNELDVNGRTAHRKLTFDLRVPGKPEKVGITLTLASPSPNDEVVKIRLDLLIDPDTAHTPSEYDSTLLYDVVSTVLGKHCPNLDKLSLYRFYENSIKPSEVSRVEVRKNGIFSHTKRFTDTVKLPFCGANFSLHRAEEWDGPPDFPSKRSLIGQTFLDIE